MAKELIYLGSEDNVVRIAIADLCDFTPRTVPVKKVPRAEFLKLRNEGKIRVVGETSGKMNNLGTVYVRVGTCAIDCVHYVDIFISGDGKFRVLHPDFRSCTADIIKYTMRKNVVDIPIDSVQFSIPMDVETLYSDFCMESRLQKYIEYTAQKLFSYGLFAALGMIGDRWCMTITPWLKNGYTEKTLYSVHLPEVHVPVSVGLLVLKYADLVVDDFYVYSKLSISTKDLGQKSKWTIKTLHATRTTDLYTDAISVQKIVGSPSEDGVSASGVLHNLSEYTGVEMLKDAGIVEMVTCFNDTCIRGDVVLPEMATLNDCFKNTKIQGCIYAKDVLYLKSCFNDDYCEGVFFGELESVSKRDMLFSEIRDSFLNTDIDGELEITYAYAIMNSFTGSVTGAVKLPHDLRELENRCFTSISPKEFSLSTSAHRRFHARLKNIDALLTVNGDIGDFQGVSVGKLIWNTSATSLPSGMFTEAEHIMDNEIPSVTSIEDDAFLQYAGKLLDFRKFPNLQEIKARAVKKCENLKVALITGKVKLYPSAFSKSPQLAHIFIGDTVENVTASAFDMLAPVVHIYYSKNPLVEKLGRLPRFKLHPNSTEQDALQVLDEHAERLEAVSVIATFAELENDKDSAYYTQEQRTLLQAVELSLHEKGICSDLSERYQIVPTCNRPLKDVAWASKTVNINYRHVYTDRKEAIRTLVGCFTVLYPYCESVLTYKADKLESDVVLSSDDYAFICTKLLVSGQDGWLYVIVDKAADSIIHAFTVGPERNEIVEIAKYIGLIPNGEETCAVLRYADSVDLVARFSDKFNETVYSKLQSALAATWLPFGSFKLGPQSGVYGVDLYTGKLLVYPYLSIVNNAVNLDGRTISDWFYYRVQVKGYWYEGGFSRLVPMLAGTLDTAVERFQKSKTLAEVTEYDTTKIPLARDIEKAKELLALLRDTSSTQTVKQVSELLLWSELVQKDGRIAKSTKYNSKTLEHSVTLPDGRIDFYNLQMSQTLAVQLVDTNGTRTQWYSMLCERGLVLNLLLSIIGSDSQEVVPRRNKYHYSLSNGYEQVSLQFLSTRSSINMYYIKSSSNSNMPRYNKLCIGVSKLSFKACLYMEQHPEKVDNGKSVTVLLWFNTLNAAYKVANRIGYTPFSYNAVVKTRNSINLGSSGGVLNAWLRTTRRAIMEGKPDGYLIQENCNQEAFDLACKQPRGI